MLGIRAILRQHCWRGGAALAHIHLTMRRLVLPLTTLVLLTLVLLDRVGDLAQRMGEASPPCRGPAPPSQGRLMPDAGKEDSRLGAKAGRVRDRRRGAARPPVGPRSPQPALRRHLSRLPDREHRFGGPPLARPVGHADHGQSGGRRGAGIFAEDGRVRPRRLRPVGGDRDRRPVPHGARFRQRRHRGALDRSLRLRSGRADRSDLGPVGTGPPRRDLARHPEPHRRSAARWRPARRRGPRGRPRHRPAPFGRHQ